MKESLPEDLKMQLALALLYLSSWKEEVLGTEVHRAWKGFDFSLLDQLAQAGMVSNSRTAKSLYLTEEGVRQAKEILVRFNRDFSSNQ